MRLLEQLVKGGKVGQGGIGELTQVRLLGQLVKGGEVGQGGVGEITHVRLLGQLVKGGEGDAEDAGLEGQEDGAEAGGVGRDHQQHKHPPERRQEPPCHGPRGSRIACNQHK